MGSQILHAGQIAEMRTGEGKTLVAVMPAVLNALAGKGVQASVHASLAASLPCLPQALVSVVLPPPSVAVNPSMLQRLIGWARELGGRVQQTAELDHSSDNGGHGYHTEGFAICLTCRTWVFLEASCCAVHEPPLCRISRDGRQVASCCHL